MRLNRESSCEIAISILYIIVEPVDENGECIVASIPRDDGEPEGRPFRYEGRLNVGSVPLHRTIYWLVRPANGALVSCTKAP